MILNQSQTSNFNEEHQNKKQTQTDNSKNINDFNNSFSNKIQNNYDNKKYFNTNKVFQNNNYFNLYNNISQNNNYYSYWNNNINNIYNKNNNNKYHFSKINPLFCNNVNNNTLLNYINPNNNYNIYIHKDYNSNSVNNDNNNYLISIKDNNILNSNKNIQLYPLINNYYNNTNNTEKVNDNISINNSINIRNKPDYDIFNNPNINTSINKNKILGKNNLKYKSNKKNNNSIIGINNDNNISNYKNIKINKNNINQQMHLEQFLQYIRSLSMPLVNYLCTSKGILDIQRKLPKSNYDFKTFIILYLNKEGLLKIMKNTYGNYFFQYLIKNSEEQFISLILSYITENFINVSKDSSGTFSLQALLDEITKEDEEQKILDCIKNHEMEMAYNKNATHVLQKLVLLFPDIHRVDLNKIILNNLKDLCLDSCGICLIKNFIRTNTIENDKQRINEEFVKNFMVIAESPYGNYGIQFLMENWSEDMLNDIKNKIYDNLFKLSTQQFSSNVVEKAIEIFDETYKEKVIKKLFFEENFIVLLKSKFGRFVLYKAINYMKNNLKNELENKLKNNLNNNNYNNKDKNKINTFLLKIQYKRKDIDNNNNDSSLNSKFLINNDINNISNNITNTNNNNNDKK
jgi:hypothetical protein